MTLGYCHCMFANAVKGLVTVRACCSWGLNWGQKHGGAFFFAFILCQCQVSFDLPFLRCIVSWPLFLVNKIISVPPITDHQQMHQERGKAGTMEREENKRRETDRKLKEDKREHKMEGKLEGGSDQSDKARAQQERRRGFTYLLAWRTRLPSSRKAWQLARNCSFCSSCSALLSCTVLACGSSM